MIIAIIGLIKCITDIKPGKWDRKEIQNSFNFSFDESYYSCNGYQLLSISYKRGHKNDDDYIDMNLIEITLKNGNKFLLEDVVLMSFDKLDIKSNIKLQDGSEIILNENFLSILLKNNKNVFIHNVKKVTENDDYLLFELNTGEYIRIMDTKRYQSEVDNIYCLNSDNTRRSISKKEQSNSYKISISFYLVSLVVIICLVVWWFK